VAALVVAEDDGWLEQFEVAFQVLGTERGVRSVRQFVHEHEVAVSVAHCHQVHKPDRHGVKVIYAA
jgi:hypothetical protein